MTAPSESDRQTSLVFEPRSIPATAAVASCFVTCLLFFCLVRPPFLLVSTLGQPSP